MKAHVALYLEFTGGMRQSLRPPLEQVPLLRWGGPAARGPCPLVSGPGAARLWKEGRPGLQV